MNGFESGNIMDMEVDFVPLFEMPKVVTGIGMVEPFLEMWRKITNGENTGVLEKYLLTYYEINNPVIKEDKFKKYKELLQCRKLRWIPKTNKPSQTGDIRVINAYIPSRQKIYLVFCYPKSRQEDLKLSDVRIICDTVKYLNENKEEE